MTFEELVDFYVKHPPIEVGDPIKYQEMLKFVADMTLLEYGKCKPLLDETTFTTPEKEGETVLYALTKIHPLILEILYLTPEETKISDLYSIIPLSIVQTLTYNPNADLFDLVLTNELEAILKEYTTPRVRKLIYKGNYIKLTPGTKYYCLFHRAPNPDELSPMDLTYFQKLLDVNLNLALFGSDIFTGEMGIRSVSLSGLSVTFNVPQPESKIISLQRRKDAVLAQLCMDYSGDMIGAIY